MSRKLPIGIMADTRKDAQLWRLLLKMPRGWFLERADEYYPAEVNDKVKRPERWCVFNWNTTKEQDIISDEETAELALTKAMASIGLWKL